MAVQGRVDKCVITAKYQNVLANSMIVVGSQ